jgi:uncharacterized membrane protein YedE/YeeE
MNPYLAGFLLGLVLLATIFVSGRGLGASGAVKGVVAGTMWAVAPGHAASGLFYQSARTEGQSPFKDWLVFEVAGLILGAFVSGVISERLKFTVERGPRVSSRRRMAAALAGGALFGIGAQLARGCTSGAALSGMAVLSAAGFLTMLAIFGSAYGVAYFFRKLWI